MSNVAVVDEAFPQLMWRADEEANLLACNQALLEYSGLTLEEVLGTGWHRMVHEEDRCMLLGTWPKAMSDGAIDARQRLLRADGEYRWHMSRAYPALSGTGDEHVWFGTSIDIHEEHLASVDLKEREQWLRTLFHAMHDGLTVRDRAGNVVLVNRASERIMGLTADQFAGLAPSDPRWGAFRPDGSPLSLEDLPSLRAVATGESQFDFLMAIRHADGHESWVNVNAVPVLEPGGVVSWVVATYADVTELVVQRQIIEEQKRKLEEANLRLEALATLDGLTGLLNHRALHERLHEQFSAARRYGRDLSVIMLDVDRFKTYNDAYGHIAGDEVLRRVSGTLREAARVSDIVGRYGGEEFLIVLPETDCETAIGVAERLHEAIRTQEFEYRRVTASFGIAALAESHANSGDLLDAADRAMYAAKQAGRDRIVGGRRNSVL